MSNRGSNSISVLETTPSLSVSASYTTGSQPLGIDSRVFSDGSIGVVSANWGDNSYTVARFMADGMMIDVMTIALPVGVSEASDAVWFPGESTRFGILARSGHLYVGDAVTN